MSPECRNSAQYITIIVCKNRKGKNLSVGEVIFGLFLIFGRYKNEFRENFEVRDDRDSKSSGAPMKIKGKSKNGARK